MRLPILMYHSVSEAASGSFAPFAVRPADFKAQMTLLRDRGHVTLTLADLAARLATGQAVPARPVVVTFDDGFRDFMSHALPVLSNFRLVATQYVVSDLVGGTSRWLDESGEGDRPLMDAADVREAHAAGIEIGAHTRTHPRLDTLPRDRMAEEVGGSKARLEDMLGAAVTTFAYPFGLYDGVRDTVVNAGFAAACAVRYRTSSPDDDRFAMARLIVRRETSLDAFAKLLDGDDTGPRMTFDRTRARAWRLVRRLVR